MVVSCERYRGQIQKTAIEKWNFYKLYAQRLPTSEEIDETFTTIKQFLDKGIKTLCADCYIMLDDHL